MNKQLYTLLLIIFAAGISQKALAQIPNASFENWTGTDPDNWFTDNAGLTGGVTQSADAHDGTKAAQLNTVQRAGLYYGGEISPTTNGVSGFHLASAPGALHGWYKATINGGDKAKVIGFTAYQHQATSLIDTELTEATSVYKEFVFNFIYSGAVAADSGTFVFELANTYLNAGTQFIIDDLSFTPAATGINNINKPANVVLEQNAPNPAINTSNIIYSVQTKTQVTLNIVDVMGRTVQTLVNENQTPGRYKAIANVSNLPVGNYFYVLNAGGNIVSKMMNVGK